MEQFTCTYCLCVFYAGRNVNGTAPDFCSLECNELAEEAFYSDDYDF